VAGKSTAGHRPYRTIAALVLIPLAFVVAAEDPEAAAAVLRAIIHLVAALVGGVAEALGDALAVLAR